MSRVDAMLAHRRTLSVELWPPRSLEAAAHLERALEGLYTLEPDFASITYGAGGSTRERTHELVVEIKRAGRTEPMAHLTCAAHRRDELEAILRRYSESGVDNVLALLGDPPAGSPGLLPVGELAHAIDLVELARSVAPLCVAVAAHPAGHPASKDLATDRRYLAEKLESADFAITQLFFEIGEYLRLVEDLGALGVEKPVLPGVMPITSARSVARMAELAGVVIPTEVAETVGALSEDHDAVRQFGIEFATELCEALIGAGAPGLHFYTMNQVSATVAICENLGYARVKNARH
ncbi:MAG: methylenetetrahydrofolate reductase [Acidimicrobiales bacterium]